MRSRTASGARRKATRRAVHDNLQWLALIMMMCECPILSSMVRLETVGDIGPISQDLDIDQDHSANFMDLEALCQPSITLAGAMKERAGQFISQSATDHLSLQENTTISLKFLLQPLILQMPCFPKPHPFQH